MEFNDGRENRNKKELIGDIGRWVDPMDDARDGQIEKDSIAYMTK